jgi:hypothetical protein
VADFANHTIRKVSPLGEVTTLAGSAGASGSDDGTGSTARFNVPDGIAVNSAGTVYVADRSNNTIRKVTALGTVTTLAGAAGVPGTADGTGGAARFTEPFGLAVHGTGPVYVADSSNHTIRKITTAGEVTTLAGLARSPSSVDGTGSAARFWDPSGVAVDAAGTVYVAEFTNNTIRKVSPTAVVTTLAGIAGWSGTADGTGSAARFFHPTGVAVDDAGTLYVADGSNHAIRRGVLLTPWRLSFDGDAVTDFAVYRPSNGTWFTRPVAIGSVSGSYSQVVFGQAGDEVLRGDFDGDGKRDPAVYRPSTGTWFWLKSSSGNAEYESRGWGVQAQNDTPAPGDYDGDGKTDPTVFRPAHGTWFILKSSSNYSQFLAIGWGRTGDTPMPGDYDGDGKTDVAIYRPSTGEWFILPAATDFASGLAPVVFGNSTDVPLHGDFDRDGKQDIAVYRSSTGTWFWLRSSSGNTVDEAVGWGVEAQGDTPVPGDYDGDLQTDVCVYRPQYGTWFVLTSSSNRTQYWAHGFGAAGDIPLGAQR